jgi:NCS1 family nucleobase:cation symporter-1
VVTVSLAVMLAQALARGGLPAAQSSMAAPSPGLFLAGVALLVIDLLSYGPFVSDYTRYLPVATSGKRLFWAIWTGSVAATVFSCATGAYITALLPRLDPVSAIGAISGKWALIIMAISLIDAGTVNAYTGAFQILAVVGTWRKLRPTSVAVRVVPFAAVMIAGVLVAITGYHSFLTSLQDFLDVLLVVFVPWSAVNLTDYFLVRHGAYDVGAFFTAHGRYGRFAWRGLAAYAIGLAVEWPFVSQPDYSGPLVALLGGADISWIVGWIVPAAAYLLLTRKLNTQHT